MLILIGSIVLAVIIALLATAIYFIAIKPPKGLDDILGEGSKDLLDLEEERHKSKKYALSKIDNNIKDINKKQSPAGIWVKNNGTKTGPVTSGNEYVPFNLSERDKAILNMFNGKS